MPSEIAMKIAKAIAPSLPDLMYQMATAEPKNTAYLVVQEQLADLIDRAADLPALEARVAELAGRALDQDEAIVRLEDEQRTLTAERDALAKRLAAVEALHKLGRGSVPRCDECQTMHPCRTVRLARGES